IDREICNDGKKLEVLLLNKDELLGLKELVNLLEPFAQATSLMYGNTYPTLSLMLPMITTLQEYLFKVESKLNHQAVHEVRDEIELNIADRWEDPKIEGYLAAILDPRFKNFKFAPEKFEEIKKYLKHKMQALDENEFLNEQPTTKSSSKLASFFNNVTITKKTSPVDTELKTYFDLPQMILYDSDDPEYQTKNPLSWWQLYSTT
ncbi:25401_t:CDS:1, partial [Dentiscutata erythropus]